MTKDEQLSVIRERCIEANPAIDNVRKIPVGKKTKAYSFDSKDAVGREIQLADVLMATEDKRPNDSPLIHTNGQFTNLNVENHRLIVSSKGCPMWYLNLPLSEQSLETIEFIYNIVK